jgi:hypothetical protein
MKMLIEQLTGTTWDKPLSRPRQLSIILHSSTRESQCVKKLRKYISAYQHFSPGSFIVFAATLK